MKIFKNFIGLAAMALCLGFASCSSDDDAPSYSGGAIDNSPLKALLESKGYTFDENGKLLLDDKANSTISLDLSGTQVDTAALKELSVFPNLKELNLSNNGYGETFDFSVLPAQITGIDLTNNDIYNYDNLVKVTVEENGDETVENLHNITKLYLPKDAKYNIAQLMRFYRQNKSAIDGGTMDVEMQNANGGLEKYNTLREIPDASLREYLKTQFSDLFDGDKLNIYKHLGNTQKINPLSIGEYQEVESVESLEGIEYIINNPYWEGAVLAIMPTTKVDFPKNINIPSTVVRLGLKNLNFLDGLNITQANYLTYVYLENLDNVESLDFSHTTNFLQRGSDVEYDEGEGSKLYVLNCPELKNIIFPNAEKLAANEIDLEYLLKLEKCDLSKFYMICNFSLGDLATSYNLVYPNLTEHKGGPRENKTYFACSQSTYDRTSTKDFIDKYYTNASPKCLSKSGSLRSSLNKGIRW